MVNKLDKILAEISAGELIDKITILEIKKDKISDKNKLIDVEKELSSLKEAQNSTTTIEILSSLKADLPSIAFSKFASVKIC